MADHKQTSGVADIAPLVARAQGCLLGQLAGDALGSLVEFQSPATIRAAYPNGVRELAEGGCWNTIAGQPTDDSEMALALARTLAEHGTYSAKRVRALARFRPIRRRVHRDAGSHRRSKLGQ